MIKNYFLKYRPIIGSISLSIIVALYSVIMFNQTLWGRIFSYFNQEYSTMIALFLGVSCLFIAFFVAISVKYLTKPLFILLIMIGSVSSYFTDQFGTIIDKDMIANAFATTSAEADNLLTLQLVVHLFVTGILPSLLILWVKIKHQTIIRKTVYNLAIIVPCLLVACLCVFSTSRNMISTLRAHQDVAKIINPVIPIKSIVQYALNNTFNKELPFQQIGLDAKIVNVWNKPKHPRVTIVVVGETARAENFSLQGYDKPTNPELEKRDVIYFSNTSSCGTATAYSLPCMFSSLTKAQFTKEKAKARENLLDVLQHAGVKVEWWDNNTGSQSVSDRVKTVTFYNGQDSQFCINGECQDGIMLEPLKKWLDNVQQDSVLVIHQLGSHGPAYFKRYPEEFRRFKPDCRGLEFSQCTIEEVRNAYDNTIVYTDYFLSTLIDQLKERSDKIDGALFYMSDHGESLGENGLYLHGMPYMLAPNQQTHVPFILWMSQNFASSMAVSTSCLKENVASSSLSQDNLFPSVLTMMNIETQIKDNRLDIFSTCKTDRLAME